MNTKVERIKADIEALSHFNSTPGNGLTRLSFTPEHKAAQEYIMNAMKEAGLEVRIDPCAAIIGRLEGSDPTLPIIATGSHFDSVRHGGNFDGPAGVVAGIEVARTFKDMGIKPRHTLEFVAMIEEEGARFGSGLFQSRAFVGKVTEEELYTNKDASGITVAEAMKSFGLDPSKYKDAEFKEGAYKNFIELHIEQGPVLENGKIDVGIVETIVGIQELEVTVNGYPAHAGTTPMNMRSDAFLVASKVAIRANEAAIEIGSGTVATVGQVSVMPGSFNIVPSKVVFFVDIRSKSQDCIDFVSKAVHEMLEKETKDNERLSFSTRKMVETNPVQTDPVVCDALEDSAKDLGLSTVRMLSGAGHDCMIMAAKTEIGLIFVPSLDGRSHCPEEWTEYEELRNGAELLFCAMDKLSR